MLAMAVWLVTTPTLAEPSAKSDDAPASSDDGEPSAEIHVVAARPRFDPTSTAASSVVRPRELDTPASSVPDLLSRVPSVQLGRTGSSADLATASIRGSTSSQVPVYLAGVRLNDDVTGTADLSAVPPWILESVTVYRGNAPDRVDQLGIGGAVLLEPRMPDDSAGGGLGLGSFEHRSAWARIGLDTDVGGVALAVRAEQAANDFPYADDRGTESPEDDATVTRQNADHQLLDVWGITRHSLGRGSQATVVLNAFTREKGVAGYSVTQYRDARSDVQRFLAGITTTTPCGRRSGVDVCQLELSTSALLADSTLTDPSDELRLLSERVDNLGRRLSQRARLEYWATDAVRVGASLNAATETLAVLRAEGFRQDSQRASLRGLGFAHVDLGRSWTLSGLVSAECHDTSSSGNPDACDVLEPSGRVGAAFHLTSNVDFLSNLNRYVRVPTLGELYGTSAFVRGNPDLGPETAFGVDAGTRAQIGDTPRARVTIDAFGFLRFSDGLISYRRSALGTVRPFNVGSARALGAELSAAADLLSRLHAEAAFALTDARDTTPGRTLTNDRLPFVSAVAGSLYAGTFTERASQSLGPARLSLGARLELRSERTADAAGLQVLPAQARLDVEAAWRLLPERLRVAVTLQNVLDTPQYDVLGLPLPGRAFFTAVESAW